MSSKSNLPNLDDRIAPVAEVNRIETLDFLRGFALMGILIVNIQAMAMIGAAYSNPTAYGDYSGLNRIVFLLTFFFFESKMMSIFSMLFGAGIILMTDRLAKKSNSSRWIHFRRMFWLLLFGLAHAHLIWYGDILYTYALCGVLVYFLRRLSPKYLLAIGTAAILVPFGVAMMLDAGMNLSNEFFVEMEQNWKPNQMAIDAELTAYRGSWLEQMPTRSSTALSFELFLFPMMFLWRASGLMLLGMAFYKVKMLTGEWSMRQYQIGAMLGLGIGWALAAVSLYWFESSDWALKSSMFEGSQFNVLGSVVAAIGYICLGCMLCKINWWPAVRHAFGSAGRLALTNYLMQSVLATLVFYGHGLGYFGYLSRLEQFGVVLAIWVFQLVVSPIWLSKFRFGPAEWLWRSLVYWKIQPLLREPSG